MLDQKKIFEKIQKMYITYSLKKKKIKNLKKGFVYHYTNLLGLEGILRTKMFWLSKNDCMNDKSEMNYFFKIFNDIAHQHNNEFCSRLANLIKNAKEFNIRFLPNDYFILSTSTNDDSHTLWSNYNEHKGFNIGLSIKVIDEVKKKYKKESTTLLTYPNFKNEVINKRLEHGYVIYNINKQKKIIRDEIEEYLNDYNKIADKDKKDLFVSIFLERMINYALFFKDPYWKHEKEYRIIQYHSTKDENNIKFRPSNNTIIPYVELDISEYINCIFNRINIGSKNKNNLSLKGINYYLIKNNFKIKAKYASNPLQ